MQEQQEKVGRQPYEKPSVRVIELATDEVLGEGCKMDTTVGPAGPPSTCTAGAGCFQLGS